MKQKGSIERVRAAALVMAGVKDNRALRDLVYQAGEQQVMSVHHFIAHCADNPLWSDELKKIANANAIIRIVAARKLMSDNMTHCKRGHELSVHGSEWKIYRNNWRHRRCMECFRINHDKGGVVKPHLVEKLKAHVLQGLPLRKAVIANQPLYIMPHNTMVAARRADPGLDRLIAAHLETRYERRLETIRAMVMPPTVPIYDNSAFFARFTDADFWKILEEVPRGLAPDKRQDVAQDVIEALLKGYIEPAGIRQHIKKYISAHYRENGSKWFAGGHLLSLDEMLCEGEIRRHDLVSEGLWS